MRIHTKRKWLIIRQYIIGWTLAFVFLSIVRGEGTQELGSVQFELWKSILVSLVGGPVFGSLSAYAQILTEQYGYKKLSIRKLLFLRIVYAIMFLIAIVTIAYFVFGKGVSYLDFAFEPGSFAIYLFIVSVDVFMFCFRQMNLFLGSNKLWKLFSGKFYSPHEEERVFMFIDLKSATSHAERLGHIKYSMLIQDCFIDLGVVSENEAEIYQYVGDEVVLSWDLDSGLKDQNCLRAFFQFKQRLSSRKGYYFENSGCLPQFKAGLHAGKITVAEVGLYKKEIAYHGDTINTASRIQAKCNELNQEFIISGYLRTVLDKDSFGFEELGTIELKGKQEKVELYAVSEL